MFPFLLAFLAYTITARVIPALIRRAPGLGQLDHPAHRKSHDRPVANLGGVALLLGAAGPTGIALLRLWPDEDAQAKVAILVLATAAAFLLGLRDDRTPLRGRHKLAGQLAIAIPFVGFGFRFQVLDVPSVGPIPLGLWSIVLTVLWMLAVCNAINLVDGADGLAGVVTLSAVAATAWFAHILGDESTLLLCAIAAGAIAAFLRSNWPPASLYLGDAGSLALGTFIAGTLVAVGQSRATLAGPTLGQDGRFEYRLVLVSLVLLYPLTEIVLTVLRRAVRGKALGSADNGHIHHCLARSSWSPSRIALTGATVSACGGSAAVAALAGYDSIAAALMLLSGVAVGVVVHVCDHPEQWWPEGVYTTRAAFRMCRHFTEMQLAKLAAARTADEMLALLADTCAEFGVRRLQLRRAISGNEDVLCEWRAVTDRNFADSRPDLARSRSARYVAEWVFVDDHCPSDLQVEYRLRTHEFVSAVLARFEECPESERNRAAAIHVGRPLRESATTCRTLAPGSPDGRRYSPSTVRGPGGGRPEWRDSRPGSGKSFSGS